MARLYLLTYHAAGAFSKYYYLLFSPPSKFDFDQAVFNTEARPLFKTGK
jgi:hypothetical protein